MAALLLSNLQANVEGILNAVPALSDDHVIVDDGRIKEACEERLVERGVAVVVGPVLGLDTIVDDPRCPIAVAKFPVEFYVNPEVKANADTYILSTMSACIRALLDHNSGTGEEDYHVEPNLCELIADAQGVRGYMALFSKTVVLG